MRIRPLPATIRQPYRGSPGALESIIDTALQDLSHYTMQGSPEERIVSVLQRLLAEGPLKGFPGAEVNLREFGLNSLDIINFVIALEAEFDLAIPENDITPANILTLSAITSLITRLLVNP
jgi:acyl carrier protein